MKETENIAVEYKASSPVLAALIAVALHAAPYQIASRGDLHASSSWPMEKPPGCCRKFSAKTIQAMKN